MRRTLFEAYRSNDTYTLVLIEEIDSHHTRLYDVKGFEGDNIKVVFPPALVHLSYDGLIDLLQKFYVRLEEREEVNNVRIYKWILCWIWIDKRL